MKGQTKAASDFSNPIKHQALPFPFQHSLHLSLPPPSPSHTFQPNASPPFLGHWSLVILWSLVIGHWSLAHGTPAPPRPPLPILRPTLARFRNLPRLLL